MRVSFRFSSVAFTYPSGKILPIHLVEVTRRLRTLSQAQPHTISAPDPRRIQQAISRLQALPAFYPTVHKALHLLNDPLSTTSHLQQVIGSDQAVASRVLRLANSAYFGFHSQVRTVSLAITLMGRDRISTLLRRFLSEELIQMLSGRKSSATHIREMSLVTATAAHSMAERLLRNDKEEILLAGLLHNIGDLLLLSQFREDYEEMLRLAHRIPKSDAETAIFGVEARIAGKWLLEAWNFPGFFSAVIENYVDPWAVHFPAAPVVAITIVHTARILAECRTARQRPEEVYLSFSPRLLSTLQVDRSFLTDLYTQLGDKLEQLRSSLT